MKAIVQCELLCGCCGTPMQWSSHTTYDKGVQSTAEYVACRQLKCEKRNVRYQRPAVELDLLEQPKKRKPGPKPKNQVEPVGGE